MKKEKGHIFVSNTDWSFLSGGKETSSCRQVSPCCCLDRTWEEALAVFMPHILAAASAEKVISGRKTDIYSI